MKKTIFTLSLLLIAATLIFTGCSSKGDFELERSKGIKVTYIDEFEKTTILPAPLTSEEIFNSYSDTIVRGTIETVRNIQIDYGKGEIAQKALATIKITKVISGNAKADSTVTVLLPKCVDNASANDSSVVISHLENGTEGIFLLKEVTEQSCAEINGKTFYYDDICEYSMFGEDHFAVILSDGAIRFNADLFDGAITSFANLDEAEAKIQESLTNFAAMIKLFSTSFLILLTVISCANVFNVITTSLNMRKREFAVLRSVGMTVNKLFAMLCIENLRNGLLAILIGGISSLPLCYLIYKSIVVGAVIDFVFPLGAFVISSLAMFLIMFLTSLYGLWKIKNGDIIADVRNDFV